MDHMASGLKGIGEENDDQNVDHTVPITPEILKGWLRRAKRKFRHGIVVVKVASTGRLVKRVVYVGAKPEYFEITSAKLFDIGYHMSDIESITLGHDSTDFKNYMATQPEHYPKPEKSCVVRVESRPISLAFKTESDRRDFMFLMRVELRAVKARYAYIAQKFQHRQQAIGIQPSTSLDETLDVPLND